MNNTPQKLKQLNNVGLVSEFGFAVVGHEACVKIYRGLEYLRNAKGMMDTLQMLDDKILDVLDKARKLSFQSVMASKLYLEFFDKLKKGDWIYFQFNVEKDWTMLQVVRQGKTDIRTIVRCRNRGLSQYQAELVVAGDYPDPDGMESKIIGLNGKPMLLNGSTQDKGSK